MKDINFRKPLRSILFVPGNHPRKIEKVFDIGADEIILDLEDAVAIKEKDTTRECVKNVLKERSKIIKIPSGYIRVNSLDTNYFFSDIQAIVGPWLTGVVVPKIETSYDIHTIEWLLSQLERERGLINGSIDLIPIIETAKGLAQIEEIAEASSKTRARRITFGAGDLTADMNMRWTNDERELYHIRGRVVLASNAARLDPPIDTVHLQLNDLDSFHQSATRSRDLGFFGKLCIHPKQVKYANEAFTPSSDEIERAKLIISAFNEAENSGSASIQVDGQFVDYPVFEAAQRTLRLVDSILDSDIEKKK